MPGSLASPSALLDSVAILGRNGLSARCGVFSPVWEPRERSCNGVAGISGPKEAGERDGESNFIIARRLASSTSLDSRYKHSRAASRAPKLCAQDGRRRSACGSGGDVD